MEISERAKIICMNLEKSAGSKTSDLAENAKYIAVVSLVPAVVAALAVLLGSSYLSAVAPQSALTAYLGPLAGIAAVGSFVGIVLGSVVALLLGAVVVQAFGMLLGGKGSYDDSVEAVAQSMTPALLLGWIPLVGIWAALYATIALVFNISKRHSLSLYKTVLVLALPGIILALIALVGISVAGLTTVKGLLPSTIASTL